MRDGTRKRGIRSRAGARGGVIPAPRRGGAVERGGHCGRGAPANDLDGVAGNAAAAARDGRRRRDALRARHTHAAPRLGRGDHCGKGGTLVAGQAAAAGGDGRERGERGEESWGRGRH